MERSQCTQKVVLSLTREALMSSLIPNGGFQLPGLSEYYATCEGCRQPLEKRLLIKERTSGRRSLSKWWRCCTKRRTKGPDICITADLREMEQHCSNSRPLLKRKFAKSMARRLKTCHNLSNKECRNRGFLAPLPNGIKANNVV